MTDDKPGRNATGRPRSRREPVTLEQKPLSVTVEPAPDAAPAAEAAEAEQPVTDTAPAASGGEASPAYTAVEAAEAPATDSPVKDTTPVQEISQEAPGISQETSGAEAVRDEPPAAATPVQDDFHHDERPEPVLQPAPQRRSAGLVVALLAGGVAGAAVSAALPFLLPQQGNDQEQRFAALEQSVRAVATRSEVEAVARAAEEAGSINAAIGTRLSALEERVQQLAGASAAEPQAEAAPQPDASASTGEAAVPSAVLDELRGEIGSLRETLASSESQVADVAGRVAAFAGQIGGLEQTVATLDPARVREVLEERPGLNDRLAGIETTVRQTLGQFDLARLAAAADTQAGEIARLATRVTVAEGAVTDAERKVQAATAASGERVAIVARLTLLERVGSALSRGQAFAAEFDTLSKLGLNAQSLAALHAAVNGLATPASLAASFAASAATFQVEDLPADAGIVDRLAASASRIVRIRPVDGDADPSDVAGQVEFALRRNDAEAALAAWQRLPEKARAQTAALAETLQKRAAAQAALAALAQDQVRALEALPAPAAQGE